MKHKEVIEPRNNRGVPDAQIAKQSWEDHKKRNDSIIIDWFQVCVLVGGGGGGGGGGKLRIVCCTS